MLNAMLLASLLAVTIPPAPANRISDGAELLSGSQAQELETLFRDVEARQGVRLGLLTVSNLDDDPKAVSVRTLNYWNMSPDSVLLLISTNPRKVFLQPGSNLQYRFSETTSVGIIRDHIVPALKSGRYGAGILNGFHAISNTLPGPVAAPPPNTGARPEPRPVTRMDPVLITAPVVAEPSFASQHPFLLFLLISGTILAFALLVRYVLRKRREEELDRQSEMASFRRTQQALREEETGLVTEGRTRNAGSSAVTGTSGRGGGTVVNTTVAPSNDGGTSLLTGVLIGEAISRPREVVRERVVERPAPAPAPEPVYTPPPSPPRHSSSSSRSSDGGGSSYDWGSSSSSSSDSGGGGGSDWGSSGGGFDSSSGGGGGGSDW